MTAAHLALGMPIAALALAGCADVGGRAYVLDQGPASYDALKAATEKCRQQGGQLQPRRNYDQTDLSGYECVFGKAR